MQDLFESTLIKKTAAPSTTAPILLLSYKIICRAPSLELSFPGVTQRVNSNQAHPRHTQGLTYRCFLPDLTGFISLRCVGPNYPRHFPGADPTNSALH